MNCENCIYGDIADWEQEPKTGQAKPVWWCLKHKCFCEDIQTEHCLEEDTCESEGEEL